MKEPNQSAANEDMRKRMATARYEAQCRLVLAAASIHFSAVVSFARDAVKTTLLINGGAAVAILTKLGSASYSADYFKWSLLTYACGVLAAAIASGLAYFAQRSIAERELQGAIRVTDPSTLEGLTAVKKSGCEKWLLRITMALIAISCLLFAAGSFIAAWYFQPVPAWSVS
ncbi:MAG: hypothetical protein ACE15C_13365 [Phycisphaerae bacterium]